MSVDFIGARQSQDQIQALHYILVGFGVIESGACVPSADSNEAIVRVYAQMLGVEVLDDGWGEKQQLVFVAPLPGDANRWVCLSAKFEVPHECPELLELCFPVTAAVVALRHRVQIRVRTRSSGGDRW